MPHSLSVVGSTGEDISVSGGPVSLRELVPWRDPLLKSLSSPFLTGLGKLTRGDAATRVHSSNSALQRLQSWNLLTLLPGLWLGNHRFAGQPNPAIFAVTADGCGLRALCLSGCGFLVPDCPEQCFYLRVECPNPFTFDLHPLAALLSKYPLPC